MLLNSLFKYWSYRILAPGVLLREKYEAFRDLLQQDTTCHEAMADFQEILRTQQPKDYVAIRHRFADFSASVSAMLESLEILAPGKYSSLKNYHRKFDFYVRFLLAPPKIVTSPPYVLWFEEIHRESAHLGNKAKHLALLQNDLDIQTSPGFALTSNAFHLLIEANALRPTIDELLSEVDISKHDSLKQISYRLQKLIQEAEIPAPLTEAILDAYDTLCERLNRDVVVAVRSSAIGEDDQASFAGQYASIMEVTRENLGRAYLQVLASKYSAEALFYRISRGFGDEETAMSVLVQEMVKARCSGVLYTGDHHSGEDFEDDLHLQVTHGHGGLLVAGVLTPESFVLPRSKLLEKALPQTTESETISGDEISKLAEVGLRIEEYFHCPQDIEWTIDEQGHLFILQARRLTTPHPSQKKNVPATKGIDSKIHQQLLVTGYSSASSGVAAGPVFLLDDHTNPADIPQGAVVVTKNTPPHYVTFLPQAAAVLTEQGSRASHFATVAREFEVPMLIDTTDTITTLTANQVVTVDGDNGNIYQGEITALLEEKQSPRQAGRQRYHRLLSEALTFITPLELTNPVSKNFVPEGCRSMHDIIRFTHEKALQAMFTGGRPGTGIGSVRLRGDLPLDVYLFDVGGGIEKQTQSKKYVNLEEVRSLPFKALWRGLSHPDVQWKQKPYDWDAFDKIELSGGVAPAKDSFAFSSYAVVGADYLHFNIRFGYHFAIIDVLCSKQASKNHCLLRFAGGGGDFDHRALRIDFLGHVLDRLEFGVDRKGDLLEARLFGGKKEPMMEKLNMLGRLFGATKLMDMVLEDSRMVDNCVDDFFRGRYSFSQEG